MPPTCPPGRQETCEACGRSFSCGVSLEGCWCWKVDLAPETLADLKQKHSRCLCPDCLAQYARKPADVPSI